jgi:dienelactone hydrolase
MISGLDTTVGFSVDSSSYYTTDNISDEETFAAKKAWADGFCFGGTMIWSIDFQAGEGSS